MSSFAPLKEIPPKHQYGKNDVLVIFGEVFQRGYINGVIDEALKCGMKVVYSTVGRRDRDGSLRPLNSEELTEKNQSPLINIPLEAGFDLEPANDGRTPVDQLAGLKMSQWNEAKINWQAIEASRQKGVARFKKATEDWLGEVESHINEDSRVVFAHIMAGGFPRAKVIMPVSNRIFKGMGERYASSEEFWNSEIGKLCDLSFNEVTAETLRHLIEATASLRNRLVSAGGRVSYLAYGYHGTEILLDGEYQWQSYSPYLQGWAKVQLENVAKEYWDKKVGVTVFNAPEILTNSSSIFLGVEVVLYPLLSALKKECGDSAQVDDLFKLCQSKLKEGVAVNDVLKSIEDYLHHPVVNSWPKLDGWPQHNGPEQMELMRTQSLKIIDMHKDAKDLMTAELSEIVFKACGHIMLASSFAPQAPVWWIGHDMVAKSTDHTAG